MAERKKHSGTREFKAVWAADEDWKSNVSKPADQEVGWALRQFNKIGARLEEVSTRREVEPLPWRDRFKRLPICTLRALPLVVSLTAIYWIVAFIIVWLAPSDTSFISTTAHWLEVSWLIAALTVIIGYRQARYPEGMLKPSFQHLYDYVKSHWVFVLPVMALVSFVGVESEAESDPMALQVFTVCVLVLAIFWAADLAAYKPTEQGEEK